jgi:Lrp/AsnC family transcriptional regulator for asnA, asnC and gidA
MDGLKLDDRDFEILEALRENAKLSVFQLSKKTGIPPTTIHNRIKKLRQNGVITNYTIKFDREKLGQGFCALIFI